MPVWFLAVWAANGQGFCLCQRICHKNFLALRPVTSKTNAGWCEWDHDVEWHDIAALMQCLEKGVLAASAGSAPDHRCRRNVQRAAITAHGFAV